MRRVSRPLVFAAGLIPIVLILWDVSANPNAVSFNAIIRNTGFWSLRFLCLTLAITPLRWITNWHSLVKFRRMMGLFGFFYGAVHTAAYIIFDRVAALDGPLRSGFLAATAHTLAGIGVDLLHPFFAIGMAGFILMVPLAATSTAGTIRRLGGRRWQALHRVVYPAAAAGVLHTYWPIRARIPDYALILGLIFLLRLGRAWARKPLHIG